MAGSGKITRPTPSGLAPAPSGDYLTSEQWKVLYALLDGVFPAIVPQSGAADKGEAGTIALSDEEFESILEEAARSRATSSTGPTTTREELEEFFGKSLTDDEVVRDNLLRTLEGSPKKVELGKVLSLLSTTYGSRLLTGYWTPVTSQPVHIRQTIIQSWVNSRWTGMRSLGKSITSMALKSVATASAPFHRAAGYSDLPRNWTPAKPYKFDFIEPRAGAEVRTIKTDVLVVGSGCGGAVCAKNLAEAGHRVLVVDKGYNFSPSQLPMSQVEATHHLFDNGGLFVSEDSSIGVTAGSCWGGGGTVNWSVSLKLPQRVREEWAGRGLPFFTSEEFDKSLDRVWEFSGASTSGIRHNYRNRVLLESARKFGWEAYAAPQNTANKEHYCGQCHLGCASGEKRGPAQSWLPAAGEAGAQFMEGFSADKIIFNEDGNKALGVEGMWTSRGPNGRLDVPVSERAQRKIEIRAKKVIIAAGTTRSPLLLMASGVENPQLGQNLHLHPVNMLTAAYDEDVDPSEGGIITSYCSEFADLDGKGHGVNLEPLCMVPYICTTMYPWRNAVDAKQYLLKYRRLSAYISLSRDRDGGRVFPAPGTGEPRIDYSVSDFDRNHVEIGVVALAKLCYVSGANEIQAYVPKLEPFIRTKEVAKDAGDGQAEDPEETDAEFKAWLSKLRQLGNKPPYGLWSSAHQMGTCRMGASEEEGVVNERGQVWGKEGLYVADTSVFPSASGVNPMTTVQAIADWISRGVDRDLRG